MSPLSLIPQYMRLFIGASYFAPPLGLLGVRLSPGRHMSRASRPLRLLLIAPRRKEGEETKPNLYEEWKLAVKEYMPDDWKYANDISISVFQGRLGEIDAARLQCDCIVSPANSYAIMDGGFDLELSRVLRGHGGNEWTLTNHCQAIIREKSGGYLPPATCLIAPLPESALGNAWGAQTLAIVPTMREPDDVSWNRDLVYNAMWSLLKEVGQWNRGRVGDERIGRVMMTGLGTGTGGVPGRVCARQMVLAAKHFIEGVPEGARWESVGARNKEIRQTYQI